MKKRSPLKKRAASLTAIATGLVAMVVCVFAFILVSGMQSNAAARESAALCAEYLAGIVEANPDDAAGALESVARHIAGQGGQVWLAGAEETSREKCLTGDAPMPALNGAATILRIAGTRSACAEARVEGATWDRVAVAAPVRRPGALPIVIAALFSVLIGAGVAALVRYQQKKTKKALQSTRKSIAALRDTAVSMAEGHLELRADESQKGEIGELGKAVNNLSHQLSRHMYTLIVERNRLKNLINGLSEGIVAIDAHGAITHTNPALDRMFTRQKLALHLPDPRMKLIPDKSIWEDFDNVIRTGAPMTRNLESKDMILRLTITPIVDEIGATAGAVGLFSDITQMERLEKTRRDYVSNVSHELRTPLTAMRALVEPLRDGMVTEEKDRMRYYDIILREIMRLSRLINDQLELSRLQSGTLSIQKRTMKIDDLIYDVCDRYSTIAEEHGLKLNVETDFSAFPEVYANEDRVEQMLIILLDNAIKYTEQGSVNVSGSFDEEKVTLNVRDTGIGIAEADLPYVFDRFYKVDKAHSGKGSGLGLSIARELLKRMDEEIWVTSEQGQGSQFSFTIHRHAKPDEQASNG